MDDHIQDAKRVFDVEIDALCKTKDALGQEFLDILDSIVNCKGKVIITGMGKPGHIAAKLAATFSSLGTSSFYLHPAEALHGDLGMVSEKDVVIAISYSGESDEIVNILPSIKLIGATLIGITSNEDSTLAKMADIVQVLPKFTEACHLGLAPTSSTTVELCYGDSLAVVASEIRGFGDKDFGRFHPAGALGKKLILKVSDLMVKGDRIPTVSLSTKLIDAIPEMTKKRLGQVYIVNADNILSGIITDGDLRRAIERDVNVYETLVDDIMTRTPKTIAKERMAIDALLFLKENNINSLPVVDRNNFLLGAITWTQIVNAGIVL